MNNKGLLKSYNTSFNSNYKYYIVRKIDGVDVDIQKFEKDNSNLKIHPIKKILESNITIPIPKENNNPRYLYTEPLKEGNILKKLKSIFSQKYTRDNRLSLLYELM